MKYLLSAATILALLACVVQAQDIPAPKTAPPMDAKKALEVASYGIGTQVGNSLKRDGVQIDIDIFVVGLKDALTGAPSKHSEQELQAAFQVLQQAIQAREEERSRGMGEKNQREGAAFLAANKGKPGVKTTASGLQYQVIRSGNGESPKASDTVQVHYEGKLLDGTIFDSSIKRGQPAEFPVNRVIPGWTEALQLMKAGDKWRLFIPSELAYGGRGAGDDIGPHSVLVFDVELLEVQ